MSISITLEKLDARLSAVVHWGKGALMTSPESDNLPEPQTIPLELGGKWIAWSTDCLRIIASGDTLQDCEQAAKKTNEHDPCFQKAPPADIRILGAAR